MNLVYFFVVMFMNRLKDLREARGMKQLELASLLRVTRQAVSRY
ncbi:MAG: helix-turn-helix transcriptional regulator, partial [Oscillospiraceae bacterium]|nr:helix-turn-helix transcriptional regulator [Oscillospiraceae bacterium]